MPNVSTAELIPITQSTINEHETLTVDAREFHGFLGVKRDFSTWFAQRVKRYEFVEHVDFIPLPKMGEQDCHGGQNRIDYLMTIDMAKQLAMVENNEKGRQVRRYFIACERRALEASQEARNQFRLTAEDAKPLDAKSMVADRRPLDKLVKTWVNMMPLGKHDSAWRQINSAFQVSSVEELTIGQIAPACAWVQERIDAIQNTVAAAVAAMPPGQYSPDGLKVEMAKFHNFFDEKDYEKFKALLEEERTVQKKHYDLVRDIARIAGKCNGKIGSLAFRKDKDLFFWLFKAFDIDTFDLHGFCGDSFTAIKDDVKRYEAIVEFCREAHKASKAA